MPTDSEYIKYCAESLQTFGRILNVELPAFPGSAPPPPPPPTTSAVTYDSGISIVASRPIRRTEQDHLIRVDAGTQLSWTGGRAKAGLTADNTDPWTETGPEIPYHTVSSPATSPLTLLSGEALVIAQRKTRADGAPCSLEEAVVVIAEADPVMPAFGNWPILVRGATQADADEFLRTTDICPETWAGWPFRYGEAIANFGPSDEPGYGGVLAERSSFGALLLCSDLPVETRKRIQDRLVQMGDHLERYGKNYDANGGHHNGRYFPWLVRRALRAGSSSALSELRFSEIQQTVPYSGPGNLGGLGFVHTMGQTVDFGTMYDESSTYNRTVGAALVTSLCPQFASSINANWSRMGRLMLDYQDRTAPPTSRWFTVKHARSKELIYANRAALGW